MASTWPHPSFVMGRSSPDEREIGPTGFTASWTTLDLARGFPSISRVAADDGTLFVGKGLGFRLVEPINLYRLVERSVKYGVLFVVLTLVSVLCLELATGAPFPCGAVRCCRRRIGAVLSDALGPSRAHRLHLGLLCGGGAADRHDRRLRARASGDSRLAVLSAALLVVLYGVLYALLRLESFALLVGTGVLLLALAMLMW